MLFGLAIAINIFGNYWHKKSTPSFLLDKLNQLEADANLIDSIGGLRSYKYEYNKNDFRHADTLKYSIVLIGKNKTLTYNATQIKDSLNEWILYTDNIVVE